MFSRGRRLFLVALLALVLAIAALVLVLNSAIKLTFSAFESDQLGKDLDDASPAVEILPLTEELIPADEKPATTGQPGAPNAKAHPSIVPWLHESNIFSLAFSPDGKILASGSKDQIIRLWDTTTGEELPGLRWPEFPITALAFSRDAGLGMLAWDDRPLGFG